MICLHRLVLAGILLLPASQALAQASIQPGRIPQQFQPPPLPQSQPPLPEPAIPPAVAPADAERIRITLSDIKIDGATVYTPEQLASLTGPLLGHEIPLNDVFALADQITARYRKDDYILSRAVVPAQRLINGVLHITVVEGYIGAVEFQGSANDLLQDYAAQITAARPIKGAVLERYLLLMNDLPGVTARAVLAPASGQTGATVISIVTSKKSFEGYLAADNQGSEYIGPFETSLGLYLNDVTGLGERTLLNYNYAYPQSELRYVAGREEIPLNSDGLLLTLSAGASASRPGYTLKPFDAKAHGSNFGMALSYPIIRSRAETWSVRSRFDVSNSQTVINNEPDLPPSSKDRIRAVRVGSSYDVADTWGGHNLVEGEFSRGLDILGASDNDRSNPSRPDARSDFRKLTFGASRRQELGVVDNLDLLVSIAAQTSFGQALPASEQFGVGGTVFGRGYEPSEITGDNGFASKLELQYTMLVSELDTALQFYGFYDFGAVHNNVATAGTSQSVSLASAGIGVRFDVVKYFSGNLGVAKPLTRGVETERLHGDDGKAPRLLMGIVGRF